MIIWLLSAGCREAFSASLESDEVGAILLGVAAAEFIGARTEEGAELVAVVIGDGDLESYNGGLRGFEGTLLHAACAEPEGGEEKRRQQRDSDGHGFVLGRVGRNGPGGWFEGER
jgi:hypothetical protein